VFLRKIRYKSLSCDPKKRKTTCVTLIAFLNVLIQGFSVGFYHAIYDQPIHNLNRESNEKSKAKEHYFLYWLH